MLSISLFRIVSFFVIANRVKARNDGKIAVYCGPSTVPSLGTVSGVWLFSAPG